MTELHIEYDGKSYIAVTRNGPLYSPRIDVYRGPTTNESQWVGAIIKGESGPVFVGADQGGGFSRVVEELFKMIRFVTR